MANREETKGDYDRDQKGRNEHHHDGNPENHPKNQSKNN